MAKGVSVQEIIKSGEPERIHENSLETLQDVEDGMGCPSRSTVLSSARRSCSGRRWRRSNDLRSGSKLTLVLIVLTVVLMVPLPPARVIGRSSVRAIRRISSTRFLPAVGS